MPPKKRVHLTKRKHYQRRSKEKITQPYDSNDKKSDLYDRDNPDWVPSVNMGRKLPNPTPEVINEQNQANRNKECEAAQTLVCSNHFKEGRPTDQNPCPTLQGKDGEKPCQAMTIGKLRENLKNQSDGQKMMGTCSEQACCLIDYCVTGGADESKKIFPFPDASRSMQDQLLCMKWISSINELTSQSSKLKFSDFLSSHSHLEKRLPFVCEDHFMMDDLILIENGANCDVQLKTWACPTVFVESLGFKMTLKSRLKKRKLHEESNALKEGKKRRLGDLHIHYSEIDDKTTNSDNSDRSYDSEQIGNIDINIDTGKTEINYPIGLSSKIMNDYYECFDGTNQSEHNLDEMQMVKIENDDLPCSGLKIVQEHGETLEDSERTKHKSSFDIKVKTEDVDPPELNSFRLIEENHKSVDDSNHPESVNMVDIPIKTEPIEQPDLGIESCLLSFEKRKNTVSAIKTEIEEPTTATINANEFHRNLQSTFTDIHRHLQPSYPEIRRHLQSSFSVTPISLKNFEYETCRKTMSKSQKCDLDTETFKQKAVDHMKKIPSLLTSTCLSESQSSQSINTMSESELPLVDNDICSQESQDDPYRNTMSEFGKNSLTILKGGQKQFDNDTTCKLGKVSPKNRRSQKIPGSQSNNITPSIEQAVMQRGTPLNPKVPRPLLLVVNKHCKDIINGKPRNQKATVRSSTQCSNRCEHKRLNGKCCDSCTCPLCCERRQMQRLTKVQLKPMKPKQKQTTITVLANGKANVIKSVKNIADRLKNMTQIIKSKAEKKNVLPNEENKKEGKPDESLALRDNYDADGHACTVFKYKAVMDDKNLIGIMNTNTLDPQKGMPELYTHIKDTHKKYPDPAKNVLESQKNMLETNKYIKDPHKILHDSHFSILAPETSVSETSESLKTNCEIFQNLPKHIQDSCNHISGPRETNSDPEKDKSDAQMNIQDIQNNIRRIFQKTNSLDDQKSIPATQDTMQGPFTNMLNSQKTWSGSEKKVPRPLHTIEKQKNVLDPQKDITMNIDDIQKVLSDPQKDLSGTLRDILCPKSLQGPLQNLPYFRKILPDLFKDVSETQNMQDPKIHKLDIQRSIPDIHDMQDPKIHKLDIQRSIPDIHDMQDPKINKLDIKKSKMDTLNMQDPKIHKLDIKKSKMDTLNMQDPKIHKLDIKKSKMDTLNMQDPKIHKLDIKKSKMDTLNMQDPKINKLDIQKSKMDTLNMQDPKIHKLDIKKSKMDTLNMQDPKIHKLDIKKSKMDTLNMQDPKIHKLDIKKSKMDTLNMQDPKIHKLDIKKSKMYTLNMQDPKIHKLDIQKSKMDTLNMQDPKIHKLDIQKSKMDTLNMQDPKIHKLDIQTITPYTQNVQDPKIKKMYREAPGILPGFRFKPKTSNTSTKEVQTEQQYKSLENYLGTESLGNKTTLDKLKEGISDKNGTVNKVKSQRLGVKFNTPTADQRLLFENLSEYDRRVASFSRKEMVKRAVEGLKVDHHYTSMLKDKSASIGLSTGMTDEDNLALSNWNDSDDDLLIPKEVTRGDFHPVRLPPWEKPTYIMFSLKATYSVIGEEMPHIIQIAAHEPKSKAIFEAYIKPKMPISPSVKSLTGIEMTGSGMCVWNKPVDAKTMFEAAFRFIEWLEQFESVVLVAHYGKTFDFLVLISALINVGWFETFRFCIVALSDSSILIRMLYDKLVSCKIEHLVRIVLGETYVSVDAVKDVEMLGKLLPSVYSKHGIPKAHLLSYTFIPEAIENQLHYKENWTKNIASYVKFLKNGLICRSLAGRMAGSGVSAQDLRTIYERKGAKGLYKTFAQKKYFPEYFVGTVQKLIKYFKDNNDSSGQN